MEWKYVAWGAIAGVIVGYLRVAKGGGKTNATPPMFNAGGA